MLFELAPGHGVDLGDAVDLVAEHLESNRVVLVCGKHLDDVASHAEVASLEIIVPAGKLHLDKAAQDIIAPDLLAFFQEEEHAVISFRRTQAVDAGDAGDDDAVTPFEERTGRGVSQAVNLVIDERVLFDVGIRGCDVGFRLVIIVVGNEILHRVFREEPSEFPVELGRQGLVVRQNQGRPPESFDDLCHGKGLARPGDAQQHLVLLAVLDPLGQPFDGGGLVAARLEASAYLEL